MLERDITIPTGYLIGKKKTNAHVHVRSESVNSRVVYVSYLDEVQGPTVLQSQRAPLFYRS
jgi:hypothetical protein